MLPLCSSDGLHNTLTSAVYFMVVISTYSTKECGLQMAEKMISRSVAFSNVSMCQTECIEDPFIYACCHWISEKSKKPEKTSSSSTLPENRDNVPTVSCGSEVCNGTSECVDEGCQKVCMEAPPLCDLHIASVNGNLSRVKFLLSQEQVDVNCQEWIGKTPVMLAATGGHREVFKLLVSKGANVSLTDRYGINILHADCIGGDVELVKYVLSQNILDIDSRVKCMRTAIMFAAENRHTDVVELLVVKGADVSLVDKTGDNIFHCACRGGGVEVVKYILSRNMVDINSRGRHKKTPVIVAAIHGHNDLVELLVKHGADMSLTSTLGKNILHHSCYHGQIDIVKYLLLLNLVDINSRGWRKRTPLMVAADRGHMKMVELLVKHGADMSLTTAPGNNILHIACSRGQFDVVKYLLSLNMVDINSRGWNNRTPVMIAAQKGYKKIVELLVKN